MLINVYCIPCLLRMTENILARLRLDESVSRRVMHRTARIPAMMGKHWDVTSIDIIEDIMVILSEETGLFDPFRLQKEAQNRMVMDLYPYLKRRIQRAEDPLYDALRLAILGNAIDFMTLTETPDIRKIVDAGGDKPLPHKAYRQFKKKIETSDRILYFGDNSGEAVLDMLFIEFLVDRMGVEVQFVTRGEPTMNDVTAAEAKFVGLDRIAQVVPNGIEGPLAGTYLDRCSGEMRAAMENTDLIIAKGGGNLETLYQDLTRIPTDISFLVVSKCENYQNLFDTSFEDPILFNRYH